MNLHFSFMKFLFIICCVGFCAGCVNSQQKEPDTVLTQILSSKPEQFGDILKHAEKHRLQILYTQIDRDANNHPSFQSFSYRTNTTDYFYPASTVKQPAAILALEKLNNLKIAGLDKYTSLRIDSAAAGQSAVTADSSSESGLPTIAHYIKRYLSSATMTHLTACLNFWGSSISMRHSGKKDIRI